MGRIVLDADIFIDMLRGNPDAYAFILQHQDQLIISVATLSEILAGYKKQQEEIMIFEVANEFQKIPLSESIAVRAGYLKRQYGKSHGSGLIDCMVAATAEALDAEVATLNKKHYPMMKGKLLVPYRK